MDYIAVMWCRSEMRFKAKTYSGFECEHTTTQLLVMHTLQQIWAGAR